MTPEHMKSIVDSLSRGRAGHAYGPVGDSFAIAIGSPSAVQLPNGIAVCVGISRGQAEDLRRALDAFLAKR